MLLPSLGEYLRSVQSSKSTRYRKVFVRNDVVDEYVKKCKESTLMPQFVRDEAMKRQKLFHKFQSLAETLKSLLFKELLKIGATSVFP